MQPFDYIQTTGGMIWTAACVLLGIFLTWLAYLIINRIPAKWLCDYNEEPSAELLSGKRVKYVGSGIVLSVIAAASLVMCRLQFNKGYDIYFIFFVLIIMVSLMIAVCDIKYTIIPDQFTIALAVLGLMISVYDIVRGFGILHTSWWSPLAGAAIGAGGMILVDLIGMLIYKKTGMGFGDVKLFAAVGILTGFPGTLYAYAIAFVSAMICFAVIIVIVRISMAKNKGGAEALTAQEQKPMSSAADDKTGSVSSENDDKAEAKKNNGPENDPEETTQESAAQETEPEENNGGSYLAFGPYIAIALICYIVFYDFIHQIVNLYFGLFN